MKEIYAHGPVTCSIDVHDDLLEYSPIIDYKALFLVNYNEVYNLLSRAISETDCLFITYNNNYIFIRYFIKS